MLRQDKGRISIRVRDRVRINNRVRKRVKLVNYSLITALPIATSADPHIRLSAFYPWPTVVMDVGTGGAEGAAAPPTFGTGEQAIVLALPKVGAFWTAMSQIDLDIAAQKAQTFWGSICRMLNIVQHKTVGL